MVDSEGVIISSLAIAGKENVIEHKKHKKNTFIMKILACFARMHLYFEKRKICE
jgi:hypothetical protein